VAAPGVSTFSCQLLADAGFPCHEVHDLEDLETAIREGAGALLLSDDALRQPGGDRILAQLRSQELPILLLSQGDEGVRKKVEAIGNVVVLEPPHHPHTLLSALRVALRARARQYELRDH